MKQSVFLVTVLTGAMLAGSAMAQMSGALICEQDAQQVRDFLESHRTTLSKEKQQAAIEQLRIYEGQCNDQSGTASAKLAALRKNLGMEPMDPQSAQIPQTPPETQR